MSDTTKPPGPFKALVDELEKLREENKDYEDIFALQRRRLTEATTRWQQAHPEQNDVYPDLGDLLKWLLDANDNLHSLIDGVPLQRGYLNQLAAVVHQKNSKWWHDKSGNRLQRNKGELMMLMVSELAEALEGERKSLMDDHLPHRRMAEVEMADTIIRILDYCGAHGFDVDGALFEKLKYNETRADHSHEARAQANGKKF